MRNNSAYQSYAADGDYDAYDPGYDEGYEAVEDRPEPPPARRAPARGGKGLFFPAFLGLLAAGALFAVYREGRRAGQGDSVPTAAAVSEEFDLAPELSQTVRRRAGVAVAAPVARTVDPVRVNDLYNQSRKLAAYATRLGPPRSGEWRAIANEPTQSYYQFARDPQRPLIESGARTVIVQPFGDLSTSGRRLLPLIADFLAAYFDMPVRVVGALPVSGIPTNAWRKNGHGHQLDAEYTLANILQPRLPADGAVIVGITAADLTPGGRWAFESAFGWSSFYGRTSLVSMARSFPGNDRREATMQDFVHLLKFAVHEASHSFGLKHCDRYVCLMNGRASLQENAAKPLWLCPDCYAKLALATGFDGVNRAQRLAAFCERQGMTSERDYWRNVAVQMQSRP